MAAENDTQKSTENGDGKSEDVACTGNVGAEHKEFSEKDGYRLIDNTYYFTDPATGKNYKYDEASKSWQEVESIGIAGESLDINVDDAGRQYYHADGMYLCHDRDGNVFYMNENNEWKPWNASSDDHTENRWYFYEGDDAYYRDKESNTVYKLNKESQTWEVYKQRSHCKRLKRADDEEEFDTDDEEEECAVQESGSVPPGYKTDPNIYYDGTNYTKVDHQDKMTYEWDADRRGWFPKLDEEFMATYQLSYGFHPDGTKNENPIKYDDDDEENKVDNPKAEEEQKKKKLEKKKPGWFDIDDAYNTKVYVSNLPVDMTEEEFIELMQKCGLVLKNTDTGKYKVKLYTDSEGNFKGDALCTYIKIESIDLALRILDGYQVGNNKICVERAKFTLKGDYNPSLKPKKKQKKELDRLQKKQEKLFDWRPEPMRGQRAKYENTVIIRNAFDPKEFENIPERIFTHKEALKAQCSSFGEMKKIELFDRNPEGVIKVTFKDVEVADLCVATLNGRLYLKRRLCVETWDGRETFRTEETEQQREERLGKWNEYLQGKKRDEVTS